MRDAIDRYKAAADTGCVSDQGGQQQLASGPRHAGQGRGRSRQEAEISAQDSRRSHDGKQEWGMRSMQDDPTRIPGVGRTSSTYTPSRKAPLWTARSTRTGSYGVWESRCKPAIPVAFQYQTANEDPIQRARVHADRDGHGHRGDVCLWRSPCPCTTRAYAIERSEIKQTEDSQQSHAGVFARQEKGADAVAGLDDAGYIKSIPDDITGSSTTWQTISEDPEGSVGSDEQVGITSVYSGSIRNSMEGTPYSSLDAIGAH